MTGRRGSGQVMEICLDRGARRLEGSVGTKFIGVEPGLDSFVRSFVCSLVKARSFNWANFCFANLVRGIRRTEKVRRT